jgi:hypothetical protein
MKKRTVAALLWFYTAWYAGAMVANLLGLSAALGPILGTAAAAIFAGDPRRIIWTNATRVIRTPVLSAGRVQNPA